MTSLSTGPGKAHREQHEICVERAFRALDRLQVGVDARVMQLLHLAAFAGEARRRDRIFGLRAFGL